MSLNSAPLWASSEEEAGSYATWQLNPDLLPLLRGIVAEAATMGQGARLVVAAPDDSLHVLVNVQGKSQPWRRLVAAALERGAALAANGSIAAPIQSADGMRGALVFHYTPSCPPDNAEYVARTHAARLETALAGAAMRLATTRGAVEALLHTLAAHDPATARHAAIVRRLARAIGEATEMSAHALQELEWGALLHDLGKTAVPQDVLRKAGPLTEAEWALIRHHPAAGERIARAVPTLHGVALIIRHHHERWDGTGYPDRLAGDAIPPGAAIVAMVDAYEVMRTGRPYRAALDCDEALQELRRGAGTQFDPTLISLLPVLTRHDVAV